MLPSVHLDNSGHSMPYLPPSFAKIVALMDSSTFEHERLSARDRAEEIASKVGLSFESALVLTPRAHPRTPPLRPSEAAAEAAARARKEVKEAAAREEARRARAAKIAPIVAKYGSEAAALAPCRFEELIRLAVAAWIEPCEAPHQRWTRTLGGFSFADQMSKRILDAIAKAYPLPTCFVDAKKEFEYWTAREADLDQLLDLSAGDTSLDLCANLRFHMIIDLYTEKLSVEDIDQLHERCSILHDVNGDCVDMFVILQRDIAHLQSIQGRRSGSDRAKDDRQNRSARIDDLVRRDPRRSDRDVAREVGCSPTTVGKRRHAIGADLGERVIKRGGSTFDMRVRG